MFRLVAAALLLFGMLPFAYAQRGGMRSAGGGGHAMSFRGSASPGFSHFSSSGNVSRFSAPSFSGRPMRFAGAPPMRFSGAGRMQFAAPRSMSAVSAPRSTFIHPRSTVIAARAFPERRTAVTFGNFNGGPSFTTAGFGRFHRHHFGFRHPFLYAVPFYYYGAYFDPLYDQYWNPYYSFGPYAYDPSAGASTYTNLSNQVGDLDAQLQELRDENDSLRSQLDDASRPAAPAPPAASSRSNDIEPDTVLVFNDGHETEVENYAIVGQTLWLLSDNQATKIPLSDLNLEQTRKVNEDHGVNFLGPK